MSAVLKSQTTLAVNKDIGLQPLFTITVDDPQKVGDPIRAFTMYTVHTKV
jgi:sorting nexin-1/2